MRVKYLFFLLVEYPAGDSIKKMRIEVKIQLQVVPVQKKRRCYEVTRLSLAKMSLNQEHNLVCWAVEPCNVASPL